MGSVSAMSSLNRVLAAHGDEIASEMMADLSDQGREVVANVILTNQVYGIETAWQLKNGVTLEGPKLDIDDLTERFPDCEVAY